MESVPQHDVAHLPSDVAHPHPPKPAAPEVPSLLFSHPVQLEGGGISHIRRPHNKKGRPCGSFTLTDITLPRDGVKKEQRCFTDEEVGKIIGAAPEPLGTILAVTSILGLRIGEVLALRVRDLDFDRKIIRVRQSVDAATRDVQAVKSQASSAD